ncbi:hypothetical protein [Natronoglomus mannanivorans]|uniref:BppU N-terminal domain-containing protein n=1 Tax=Natronoglomus mannanivorans TaxID=2979990 RepID=A0AAP3E456_9EURY|nr:hypothetical protein [Halobacteria archaeon AArc-xg1-1]
MSESFHLKKGDTAPSLEAILRDDGSEPVDLTEADVWLRLQEPRGGGLVLKSGVSVIDEEQGHVRYVWSESDGDTEQTGRHRADFIVKYPDGAQETFPNDGFHDVVITE